MKKRLFNFKSLLLIIATGLLSMSTFAQMQIGNSDFEQWDDAGSTNEEPVNWNSFMTANCTMSNFFCGQGQKQRLKRSIDAHSGNYSARIYSTSVLGIVANGNMTLGRVNMGSSSAANSSNFNFTDIANPDFNQTFTDKPDSLVVWVKYNPVQATSLARISATIHDNYNYRDPENAAASPHKVAQAILNYGSTNSQWSRISIPFDYVGPSTDAQYILITFTTSSTAGGGDANDEVFIDDLELIYNANEVEIAPIAVQSLFVNESGNVLTATETPNAASSVTARQWKSSTTAGGPYTAIAGETGTTYTPSFSTAGTYYVVCETDFDGDVVVSNEVQVIVDAYTASIAPVAVQNLIENQNGSILTVTENATADSRQWKYATTAGGPYIDITGETATIYTPLFPTAGTYYVVCEYVLAGTNVISNEVQINVIEFTASITPAAVQNLVENQTGSTLTVTESQAADSRQWKYASTSGGPYTNDIAGQTAATYTPQFSTAGTYFVVCETDFDGFTTRSNEVKITVESTAGVSDAELQTFSVYAVGHNIIVDLSDVEIKDATIQVLNAQGRVVAKEQFRSNVLNSVQLSVPQGIYFYSIHSGLNHYSGKVYIKN